jgi:hypothetical protein
MVGHRPRVGQDSVEFGTFDFHDKRKRMFRRALPLPPPREQTFFLWGPRQTGRTKLLREAYPNAFWWLS